MERIGASKEDVAQVLELYTYQQKMREPMVADTDREVSDEEAAQTTVTYARISLEGEDGAELTEDEKAELKADAEEVLAQIQASADPSTADFSTIADGVNEDFMASSLSYGSDDTILEDTVKEAVSSLTDGQVYGSVIETEEYYYIVRLDQAFDAEATETEKESIISQRESENYDAKLQEWVDASAVDTKSGWDNLRVTDKDLYVVKAEDTSGEDGAADSSSVSGSSAGTDSSSVSGSSGTAESSSAAE